MRCCSAVIETSTLLLWLETEMTGKNNAMPELGWLGRMFWMNSNVIGMFWWWSPMQTNSHNVRQQKRKGNVKITSARLRPQTKKKNFFNYGADANWIELHANTNVSHVKNIVRYLSITRIPRDWHFCFCCVKQRKLDSPVERPLSLIKSDENEMTCIFHPSNHRQTCDDSVERTTRKQINKLKNHLSIGEGVHVHVPSNNQVKVNRRRKIDFPIQMANKLVVWGAKLMMCTAICAFNFKWLERQPSSFEPFTGAGTQQSNNILLVFILAFVQFAVSRVVSMWTHKWW